MLNDQKRAKLEKEGWEFLTYIPSLNYKRGKVGLQQKTNEELLREFNYVFREFEDVRIELMYDIHGNIFKGLRAIYVKKK